MRDDALRQRAQARLAALRQDLANGRAQLAHLHDILPRIEGAVQVLEEILHAPEEETPLCPNPNAAEPMSSA